MQSAAHNHGMGSEALPRVTVISSNPFSRTSSTGLMLNSFFRLWPSESLSQIYFPIAEHTEPDFSSCKMFRKISVTGSISQPVERDGTTSPSRPTTKNLAKMLVKKAKRVRPILRISKVAQELWYSQPHFVSAVRHQIKELAPDLIFAYVGSYSLSRLVYEACRDFTTPVYTFVADDYVNSLYEVGVNRWALRELAKQYFRRLTDRSCGRACISPLMAESFEKELGSHWNWFATFADSTSYVTSANPSARPSDRPSDSPIQITYTGELGIERWKSLRLLALALQKISISDNCSIRLSIYASAEQLESYRKELSIDGVTQLLTWVPHNELPAIYRQSDLLVHAESFSPDLARYTHLSFSTKLSHYMMAERCIFFLGPMNCGSSKMVRHTDSGLTVDSQSVSQIASEIQPLIADREMRSQYACRGRAWAVKWLDSQSGSQRFHDTVLDAMKTPKMYGTREDA